MHEFLLKILPLVIIIGITLAVAPGRRKEKKLGHIHTYDTYGKMFFYAIILPMALIFNTACVLAATLATLRGGEIGLLFLLLPRDQTSMFFVILGFLLLAVLHIWSLVHCVRHFNSYCNAMYCTHAFNIFMLLLMLIVSTLRG